MLLSSACLREDHPQSQTLNIDLSLTAGKAHFVQPHKFMLVME